MLDLELISEIKGEQNKWRCIKSTLHKHSLNKNLVDSIIDRITQEDILSFLETSEE